MNGRRSRHKTQGRSIAAGRARVAGLAPGNCGFSLLELILAMGMVSILALSLYASMRITFKARDSAQSAVEPARATAVVSELIGRDLEGVLPPTGTLAGPFVVISGGTVGAESDYMQFCAIGSDGSWEDRAIPEGIRRIELTVRTDLNPPALVRRVTRNLLASLAEDPEEEVLVRGVKSFAVRLYDGTSWSDEWDSTLIDNIAPVAVGIDLVIEIPGAWGAAPATYRIQRIIPLACGQILKEQMSQ
ncbi:MAG TPA: GspJ family type II secretion system protein [Tepidisphaeraceae bacterium]|nr:GspJ family type II secretion system protein [Tepidisphaeraceae bacterium]